jgi:serine phosphatase RsbU (regulator of sigma subunit)
VPEVQVATRYAPGAARLDVGGDFYDLFASGPGVWNAVVGDVCGKGAEAAALTALARHTLRALAGTSTDPADLLVALNAAILREGLPGDRFITMVLARLVPRAGDGLRLDLACAGHPPPLVARRDGSVEEVWCGGPLLGIDAAPRYRTRHVDLAPEELAVLYTDGLSEAARGATGDGYVAVPGRLRDQGAEAVAGGLEAWAVEARDGGEANDDLAVLVIGA